MIDCGEGTQEQVRRSGIGFSKISAVFISHIHGDHVLGLIGMISTFGLQGRTAPLHIYGPKDYEELFRWQKVGVTLVACLLTCTSDWSCAAPLAILMIGRNRGCFHKQMLWMMAIISLYAVAFFIFHSPTYGMVHLACWLAVPLLAMYNGQRGRLKWLGKFFYYYYPAHMAVIGLLARCFQ